MTDQETNETPQAARPGARPFRKPFNAPRLDPESAARQGKVATLAFVALGREAATEFLNSFDETLGGRPLDLAVASAEGLAAVEQAIAARAS